MKIKPLVAMMAVLATSVAMPVSADIVLDKEKKVSLFGDLRIRGERDDSEKADASERDRERFRYRARLGVKFAPAAHWQGQIRMATNSGGLNSPHSDFSTDNSQGADFGIDQAYLTYRASDDAAWMVGKMPLAFWNTTETFWDEDINIEGGAFVYTKGNFTFNGTYAVLNEGGFGRDTSAFLAQGIYKNGNLKVALGNVSVDAPSGVFQAEQHFAVIAEYQYNAFQYSAEYINSDAESESVAYTLQARYKISDSLGLRAYWFHTEAFSVLGDGTYGQDDFPNPNSTGVSNFEGIRLQLDYQINPKIAFDLKWFDMERIEDASALSTTTSDAIFNEPHRTRLQFNLNYKF